MLKIYNAKLELMCYDICMKKIAKTLNKIFTSESFMEEMAKNCYNIGIFIAPSLFFILIIGS